jgi:hypothetical protein
LHTDVLPLGLQGLCQNIIIINDNYYNRLYSYLSGVATGGQKLRKLTQKIGEKHSNRALACPVYLLHSLDWLYWFNLSDLLKGSANASEKLVVSDGH